MDLISADHTAEARSSTAGSLNASFCSVVLVHNGATNMLGLDDARLCKSIFAEDEGEAGG